MPEDEGTGQVEEGVVGAVVAVVAVVAHERVPAAVHPGEVALRRPTEAAEPRAGVELRAGAAGRAVAAALGAALAVMLGSAAARTPAVAEYWGQLVRQLGLREVAEPPPHPGVFRDAAGAVQELPIAVAGQPVTFTLLVPRELPPGCDAGTGVAIVRGSSRSGATLRFVERGAEARRRPAISVDEVAHSALAPPGRELPIKAGTAEAVRILARDPEPPDGPYVAGAWAYRSGSPAAEHTPALHSVSLDRAGVRVFVRAVRSRVPKDQLIRVRAVTRFTFSDSP